MSMYRVFSCFIENGCLLWPVHSIDKTVLAFGLLHFVLQGQICLLLQVSLDFLLLHSSPLWWQGHPRRMGHCGEFWQNVVHWRREWQTTSVFLPWDPHEQYEKAKRYNLKEEPPRLVDVQYATGEEQKNSSRRNEEAEPKWKQRPVVDVSGGESKVWFCKEQYCIGTWNVRSVKQGKLKMVKTGDSKSEHWHFRNWWTKMDQNERI